VALLIVMIASTGVLAYAALGPAGVLLGADERQSPELEEAAPPPSPDGEPASAPVPPDSPPDPSFDELVPILQQRTTTPSIMLPAELPSVLENVAVDRDLEGDRYGIVFFREPPDNLVEVWGRAEVYGTLRATPAEEKVANEYFEAASVETFRMPDGAEATLRRMEPVREQGGTQGPFWEGSFREGNHSYALTLLDDTSREMPAQVLSTIVEVPRQQVQGGAGGDSDAASGPAGAETEALRPAVEDYYRTAGSEDWDYTYDALDSEIQALFAREEWSEKNQWFADNAPAIYHIESVELDDTSQEPLAEVSVRLTGEDGSSSVRTTYFVYEDGEWKHRFGQEEKDLFEPGVPFEEWVDSQ
jgi:hypothetical protein